MPTLFRKNFEDGIERGAACSVYVDGVKVVDLWAGIADPSSGRAWDEDTVTTIDSATKGATAICAHMLVERGQLDLDSPVADYWPEFAQNGKASVTPRFILAHQAGLPVIDRELTFDDLVGWEGVIEALEDQTPLWDPGTQHAYHALTIGFLVGELVRRLTGETIGRFFAENVAQPFALQAWIGIPEEIEPRLAARERGETADLDGAFRALYRRLGLDEVAADDMAQRVQHIWADPQSVWVRAGNPGRAFSTSILDERNNRRLLRAELPASNMVADARSLARLYAATVSDVDGARVLNPASVDRMRETQTSTSTPFDFDGMRQWAHVFTSPMALGVMTPSPFMSLLGPDSFGHPGAGGALGFGDVAACVGFGYVPNFSAGDPNDPRARRLIEAVNECLG